MKPIRKEAKRAIREYLRLHQKGVSCATESALWRTPSRHLYAHLLLRQLWQGGRQERIGVEQHPWLLYARLSLGLLQLRAPRWPSYAGQPAIFTVSVHAEAVMTDYRQVWCHRCQCVVSTYMKELCGCTSVSTVENHTHSTSSSSTTADAPSSCRSATRTAKSPTTSTNWKRRCADVLLCRDAGYLARHGFPACEGTGAARPSFRFRTCSGRSVHRQGEQKIWWLHLLHLAQLGAVDCLRSERRGAGDSQHRGSWADLPCDVPPSRLRCFTLTNDRFPLGGGGFLSTVLC